jgi:hypothetical protein
MGSGAGGDWGERNVGIGGDWREVEEHDECGRGAAAVLCVDWWGKVV